MLLLRKLEWKLLQQLQKIIKITVNQGRKAQPAIEEFVKVIKRFIYNI